MTDHSQNPSETDSPDPDPRDQLLRFAKGLGYLEGECGQLETALTHKSYANEAMTPTEHNERLEFLGDAVLGLLIGHALMVRHPSRPEGDLSRLRAALVNARTLAGIGRSLELGGLLRLGRGEERTGGRAKESLLADAYEAVIGAVFLDLGLGAAEHAVLEHFAAWIAMEDATAPERDYKTSTQELVQGRYQTVPAYRLVDERGPDHAKEFTVEVEVAGQVLGRGVGPSKKLAEREAARQAWYALRTEEGSSLG